MGINKRLIGAGAIASSEFKPSEHFGVVLYEGNGSSSHSINGGKFGAGAFFNGSNGKIDINRNVLVGNNWTISMWVRVASGTPYTNYRFYDSSYGDYAGKLRLGINTDGTVSVAQGNSTSAETSFNSTGTINDNAWHNLSVTFDGTTARLYIDGSADGTGTPSNYSDSTGDARIGGGNTITGSNPFKPCEGKIDQVRIFQKELSSSEVSTLYAETVSTVESLDPLSEDTTDTLQVLGDTSCLALYKFDNNEDDKSGNYNGTGTEIQYAAGRYDQSAVFNGSSSVVTLPSALSDGSTTDATCISFWFYTGNEIDSSTTNNEIMTFSNSGSNPGKIALGSTTGNFGSETISVTSDVLDQYTYSTTNIPAGWNHVVVQWNSGNTKWDIYVNNVAHTTYTFGTNQQGKFALKFGQRSTFYYTGRLDQIRVFNKILSTSEIKTLYEENSLVASYRFEGNSNDDKRNNDGTDSNVTYEFGLNFTPDFVWVKERTSTSNNYVTDSSRTLGQVIATDSTGAEGAAVGGISSLDTGGFTVGSHAGHNENGQDYVAWCLKANGGTTSSNSDGNITSTVQTNTDAGFSIINWTSTSTISDTIGHGLNKKPDVVLYKKLSGTSSWYFYTDVIDGSWDALSLNLTDAKSDVSGTWATSSTFKSITSVSGSNWITYCFHSVEGFSKFGSYTGNGDANGPIVETGFEPAFVMVKNTSTAGYLWLIADNKRQTSSLKTTYLQAQSNAAEYSPYTWIEFLSNGFQLKNTGSSLNANGDDYIYMAFAADPDTEAPTLARSFSVVTYSGTGANQSIEGLGFKPGFVWLKGRSRAEDSGLFDTVRGSNLWLRSSTTAAETDFSGDYGVLSFDDDGFSIGTGSAINNNGDTFVGWAWAADDNEPTIFGGPAKAVYKFEDNANDVGGNYNGSVVDTVTYVTGNFNKAANFTASGTDKNEILTTLTESPSVGISLSCWVKFSTLPSGGADSTFVIKNSGTEYIHLRYEDYQSKGFSMQTKNSSSNVGAKSEMTASTGVWYHVVGTVNSGGTGKIYVNGELKATNTGLPLPGVGSEAWRIGGFDTAQSTRGDYAIDQVRIYYDEIKQEQVDELYAETVSDNDDMSFGGAAKTLISANANAGFSIVKYIGNGSANNEIPHGLSSALEFVLIKNLNDAEDWQVFGNTLFDRMQLNNTGGDDGNFPLSYSATTITLPQGGQEANNAWNASGDEYIMYCFHSVAGYSKIGTYTGNATSNTVTTGFQPDFIMIKQTSASGQNWIIHDSVRTGNPHNQYLMPSSSAAESSASSTNAVNFLSNGFELIGTGNATNGSGATYIYMAFKIN